LIPFGFNVKRMPREKENGLAGGVPPPHLLVLFCSSVGMRLPLKPYLPAWLNVNHLTEQRESTLNTDFEFVVLHEQ
jgi:hypothetical protein